MEKRELIKYLSREIQIGDLRLGGKNPIRLQSMTNTNTLDTQKSVEQCIRIFNAGADLVRLTAQGIKEAENLKIIKHELIKKGYKQALVADIHFNPKAAEIAAQYLEKVRINPGNYIDKQSDASKNNYTEYEYGLELEKIHDKIIPLIKICKQNGTAIRIGTNHGSLSNRIMSRYGDSPEGMAQSALEFLRVFEAESFHNLVLSMKSSNTRVMVYSTRLLAQLMQNEGMNYPLHLGVTEAGEGEDGRIKSAVGIGTLLHDGLGDTIRISLTEEPEFEIPVAKKLVSHFNYTQYDSFEINFQTEYTKKESTEIDGIGGKQIVKVIGDLLNSDQAADLEENFLHKTEYPSFRIDERIAMANLKKQFVSFNHPIAFDAVYNDNDLESFQLKAAADIGSLLIDGYGDALHIYNPYFSSVETTKLAFGILQASRMRFTKTDYISCPGCGRTLFNLQNTLQEIKAKTSHLKNLKIGIMGCIVNGPGEMADADYGYVGAGPKKITLYKNKEVIKKNIPEEYAVDELIQLIKDHGDWYEK